VPDYWCGDVLGEFLGWAIFARTPALRIGRCLAVHLFGYLHYHQRSIPERGMTLKYFLGLLLATCGIVAVAILGLQRLLPTVPFASPLAWWSLVFFVGLSLATYFLGRQAAVSDDKLMFNNVIMLMVFGKMFLSFSVVFAYYKVVHPGSRYFVFPFFVVYIFFTIFEVYFMTRLAHLKRSNS